jgi:hypothetical protein
VHRRGRRHKDGELALAGGQRGGERGESSARVAERAERLEGAVRGEQKGIGTQKVRAQGREPLEHALRGVGSGTGSEGSGSGDRPVHEGAKIEAIAAGFRIAGESGGRLSDSGEAPG